LGSGLTPVKGVGSAARRSIRFTTILFTTSPVQAPGAPAEGNPGGRYGGTIPVPQNCSNRYALFPARYKSAAQAHLFDCECQKSRRLSLDRLEVLWNQLPLRIGKRADCPRVFPYTFKQIERFLFITSPQSNMNSLAIQHEATRISTLRQMVWNICGHNPKTLKGPSPKKVQGKFRPRQSLQPEMVVRNPDAL
jgi:hypothetical protein